MNYLYLWILGLGSLAYSFVADSVSPYERAALWLLVIGATVVAHLLSPESRARRAKERAEVDRIRKDLGLYPYNKD